MRCNMFFASICVALTLCVSADATSEKEAGLIAVLESDAPKAEKATACKQLAIYGSGEAVPALAKLLGDEQLASWCRIALEAIPDKAADEALRASLADLEGNLLVGAINSIAVRKDAEAIESLEKKLTDPNAVVASASAVALGHIGNPTAAKILREKLASAPDDVKSAVAEGCILCAEFALAADNADDAISIYDEVLKADVPRPRIREATRGAILARGQDGIPLLVEQLNSPDEDLFQIGLSTAREFPGGQVDQTLADEMGKAVPVRAALILMAMADRPDTVVLPAVLKAAAEGAEPVRLAAITALGKVGNETCLDSLLKMAVEDGQEISRAASKSLRELPGETVNAQIVKRLEKPDAKSYPLLVELVGERRIVALPLLQKALKESNPAIRQKALIALGYTVPEGKLSLLTDQVLMPSHPEDAETAQQALKAASIRMPDREACATELAAALKQAKPITTKVVLLDIIGAVAGTKALETLSAAAKSNEDALQDKSTDLLGNWLTVDAGPVLLDLAQNAPGDKYQVRAQRGYIRIARQFVAEEKDRLAMYERAFELTKNRGVKTLILEALRQKPSLGTLDLAIQARRDHKEIADEAMNAVVFIAQKVNTAEAKKLFQEARLPDVKVEIIKAEYGAGQMQKDVTDVLKEHVKDSLLIDLPSSYNELFGDPAPGAVKQLKVQFKLGENVGEATFAENALVILPLK